MFIEIVLQALMIMMMMMMMMIIIIIINRGCSRLPLPSDRRGNDRDASLRTKGSGGPSGVDSTGFKRILCCKSFKSSSTSLCDALATMTRKLCTEYIDPHTIEPHAA